MLDCKYNFRGEESMTTPSFLPPHTQVHSYTASTSTTLIMSMEVDSVPLPQVQARGQATVLCYNCGAPIDGTLSAGAVCADCLRLSVDAAQGIPREATLHTCRDCERWLQPPNSWVTAALESRELLALCLRKLRGLNKVRIIDASFIWTEPHSRRVKVKITIQQEVSEGTIMQQSFEVEYVVHNQQCPDCAKSFTANTWRSVVQVRQKVLHKRTFLYLEQLILKHGAHKDTINIKEVTNGLDFFFAAKHHAEKFVDFLTSATPVRTKKSQELISVDIHTSSKSYKFTYSCELIPICKDDLVALPIGLSKTLGNISPLALCHRVGTSVNFIDPNTLQTADLPSAIYWRNPFKNLADVTELTEFIVLDIEGLGPQSGRFFLAEATVAKASDLGSNDKTYICRTHLGGVLHAGDSVMGYHITGTNFNNPQFEALENSNRFASQIPDVVLVKKHYARRRKPKNRSWRLKRMAKDEGELLPRKADQQRLETDYEMFLRDVEEDEELRNTVALYKAEQARKKKAADEMSMAETHEESEEDEVPKINMDQLLDDFDDLSMGDEEA